MNKWIVYLQYVFPKRILSNVMGKLSESNSPWLKLLLINFFMKRFQIDLQQAVQEDKNAYQNFNDFFTRHLKKELRPIDSNEQSIVSPVDGIINQLGHIKHDQLVQAKNFHFDLPSLLGGQVTLANNFIDGSFATLYLAPYHYHRVHMPIDGTLIQTIFIPGDLFSVNQMTADYVPRLYSRNERLVCIFETPADKLALIFVGATLVGSINLSCVNENMRAGSITVKNHQCFLKKGEELGYFKMGSTIILLFEKDKTAWQTLPLGSEIKMGQVIGEIKSNTSTV